MLLMKVNFFATYRQITGELSSQAFNAATLRELLEELFKCYGEKFRRELMLDGKLSSNVLILVNGRAIEHLNGLKTALSSDDVISIFPKLAGG